jgi:hypothetical protein
MKSDVLRQPNTEDQRLDQLGQLEARVGIGQFTPLLQPEYSRFHWLFNIIRDNPTIPVLTPLVSVLVSAVRQPFVTKAALGSEPT